jgi:hypothetical protein
LVLYDEGKGLRKPEVQLFNPSPTIEKDVNEWIKERADISVHRVEWIPSGGKLGASVTYSHGEPTQSLRIIVPGLEAAAKRIESRAPLEQLARFLLALGVVLGIVGMGMFALFYPETWYGRGEQVVSPALAVKSTVLVVGMSFVFMFSAVSVLFRARVT